MEILKYKYFKSANVLQHKYSQNFISLVTTFFSTNDNMVVLRWQIVNKVRKSPCKLRGNALWWSVVFYEIKTEQLSAPTGLVWFGVPWRCRQQVCLQSVRPVINSQGLYQWSHTHGSSVTHLFPLLVSECTFTVNYIELTAVHWDSTVNYNMKHLQI